MGLIPAGYHTVVLGSGTTLDDLKTLAPLEESTAEGSLMLMRLDFADFPTSEVMAKLEKSLHDAGVPTWVGGYVVYADTNTPSVYLTWQKGLAWTPIIIGILLTTVLPALLGGVIWLLMPESMKSLITGMIDMGMMMVVMWLMTSLMKPMIAATQEKPMRLEEANV